MAFADAEGAKIYYEQHGSGPAIMLIHGSGGHHMAWWHQVAYLARWFTVLTIDLRGFGNSTPVEGGPDSLDFVKDIEAVLDASGVERCALLGQSIGALSALRVAVRRPQRIAAVLLAHSLGGINDAELADLAAANRREAEKLPVLDRLLTKEFQSGQPALTFLFRQMGTFNHAKMQDLRNPLGARPRHRQDQRSRRQGGLPVRRARLRTAQHDYPPGPPEGAGVEAGRGAERAAFALLGDARGVQRHGAPAPQRGLCARLTAIKCACAAPLCAQWGRRPRSVP